MIQVSTRESTDSRDAPPRTCVERAGARPQTRLRDARVPTKRQAANRYTHVPQWIRLRVQGHTPPPPYPNRRAANHGRHAYTALARRQRTCASHHASASLHGRRHGRCRGSGRAAARSSVQCAGSSAHVAGAMRRALGARIPEPAPCSLILRGGGGTSPARDVVGVRGVARLQLPRLERLEVLLERLPARGGIVGVRWPHLLLLHREPV